MKSGIISAILVMWSMGVAAKNIVTIVVLEGKALLVTVDEQGIIVETYMEVSDYFATDSDHETKVEEAKRNYEFLSQQEINQIRFIPLLGMNEKIDQSIRVNIQDLAQHYLDTYANQITITVAKNNKTAHLLDQTVRTITNELSKLGVSTKDIKVDEKIDMGDEPTQFVKVVSTVKSLPSL